MEKLIDFLQKHATRGACQCGRCIDAVADPAANQPTGHTADMIFFKVAARGEPDPAELKRLIEENKDGEFDMHVDLFDGKEHNYMELGAWIGDQGLAITLMGLGTVLGLWKLLSPRTVFGNMLEITEATAMQLAGGGLLSIMAGPTAEKTLAAARWLHEQLSKAQREPAAETPTTEETAAHANEN